MAIETQRYIRKPLYVEAVRVTAANFEEIAAWCQGEILRDDVPGVGSGKKYIKVRVHNPVNPRQTKAFVGDWLLYTERGYKVYTNKAFHAAFDKVGSLAAKKSEHVAEAKVSDDPATKAALSESKAAEALDRKSTPIPADIHDASSPPPVSEIKHELVAATPENIAQAIMENDKAREDLGIERDANTKQIAEALDIPEETVQNVLDGDRALQTAQNTAFVDGEATIEPAAAAERRILSVEEQQAIGPNGVRELVQSGEAVLAQDIN